MRILPFVVSGQRMNKDGDFSGIVRGTKEYLKCQFTFKGTDWNGCKIVAVFEDGGIEIPVALDSNRTCMVPNEITDSSSFKMKIIGRKNSYQIVSNILLISQEG